MHANLSICLNTKLFLYKTILGVILNSDYFGLSLNENSPSATRYFSRQHICIFKAFEHE